MKKENMPSWMAAFGVGNDTTEQGDIERKWLDFNDEVDALAEVTGFFYNAEKDTLGGDHGQFTLTLKILDGDKEGYSYTEFPYKNAWLFSMLNKIELIEWDLLNLNENSTEKESSLEIFKNLKGKEVKLVRKHRKLDNGKVVTNTFLNKA